MKTTVDVKGYHELMANGRNYFKCPFCWTSYNKQTGKPLKSSRQTEHEFSETNVQGDICPKFPYEKYTGFKVKM